MRMVLHCGALAFKKIKIKGHQFLEVSDGDHIDRLLSCLYIALPLFKRGASSSKFINYLIKHIIPVFDMFPEERKGDLLKNLAECSHHVAPQECRQLLPSVVQLLKVQNSLSYAVRTGRLSDSHGREVSIGNAVFVTASRSMEGNKNFSSTKETSNYSEENILGAKGWPIQLLMGFDLGDNVVSQNSRVLNITRNGSSSPVFMNKRKLITSDGTLRQHQTLEVAKRAHTESKMSLDLNLPAEDGETSEVENSGSDPISENTKAWLEDFLRQLDETVIFKPFDFDAVAEKKLKEITRCFHKIVGSEGSLEIDSKVMEQILAAACLSDDSSKVDDWVNQVLGNAFEEAQKRYNLSSRSVVKLVTCEDQEQTPGLFLPARIILN